MSDKEEASLDSACYRKFGLPNWMVNNIERLNFVTDFEQYACSPPETEGFLTEHIDSCDFYDTPPISVTPEPVEEKPKISDHKLIPESKSSPSLLMGTSEQIATLSIMDSLKHEELCSSPDSTPCATPEPSPAPRRRMSGQQDTVQTNPGRWFYLGNFKKTELNKGQNMNVTNKENRSKSDKSSDNQHKLKSSPVKPKKDRIKLVISNFDLNAISPSSW